jgi:hypothetical protein
MSHVVFKPKKMTAQELQEGYLWAQKYACAPRSILKRLLWGSRHHFFYFLMSNFVLRGGQMEMIRRVKREEMPNIPITKLQSPNNNQGSSY